MYENRGRFAVIIISLLIMLCSCQANDNIRNDMSYIWEVQLEATNVSSEGVSLRVIPYSSVDESIISYGHPFWIAQYQNGEWIQLETITGEQEYVFSTERNLLDVEDTITLQINWASVYGSLEPGHYRLTKVWTCSFDGKSEDKSFGVEFYIK